MAHTRATIATMARLARAASHSYPIRSLATRITHDAPSGDVRGELAALYTWVRDHIRYRFDPRGLEWVQSPQRTVIERAGDCDDLATLLAGLAGALGHRWQFITVGPSAEQQRHIAAQAWDGEWVTLDPVLELPMRSTKPRPAELGRFGDTPPGVSRCWDAEGRMLSGPVGPKGARLWRAGGLGRLGRPVTQAEGAYFWPHVAAFPASGRAASGEGMPVYSSAVVPGPPPARAPYPGALGEVTPGTPGLDQWARAFLALRLRYRTKSGEWIARNKLDPRIAAGEFGPALQAALRAGHKIGVRSKGPNLPTGRDLQRFAQVALPVAAAFIPGAGAVLAPIAAAVTSGGSIAKGVSALTRGDFAQAARSGAAAAQGAGLPVPSIPRIPGLPRVPAAAVAPLQRAGRLRAVAAASGYAQPARVYAPQPAALRARVAEAKRRKAAMLQQMRSRSFWPSQSFAGFRPTISFALGAVTTMPPAEYVKHGRTFAQAAGNAVAAHIESRADKRPPGKKLPAVQEFQLYDSRRGGAGLTGQALAVDGLWGSNTRAAAAYYLSVPVASMPATLPALSGPVTWQPPKRSGVAVAPAPAPARAPSVAVAPKPAAKAAPVITVTPAPARAVAVAPRPMPALPTAAVVPVVSTPRVIDVDSPRRVAPVLPAAPLPVPVPVNLAPPPFPDEPQSEPGVPVTPAKKSDSGLLWLGLGYLWLRSRKKR